MEILLICFASAVQTTPLTFSLYAWFFLGDPSKHTTTLLIRAPHYYCSQLSLIVVLIIELQNERQQCVHSSLLLARVLQYTYALSKISNIRTVSSTENFRTFEIECIRKTWLF